MNRRGAIIFCSVLLFVAILVPVLVLVQTARLKSGYKDLPWGRTESQVQEWTKKNSNKATWARCNLSHFGITCYRLFWKNKEDSPFEYIEFQFQNGKLCAVIETNHEKAFDPAKDMRLGRPDKGTDLSIETIKTKGIKYRLCERVFYYNPVQNWKSTKVRYAVERLVRENLSDSNVPDEVTAFQLTTGYYEPDYYEQIKDSEDFFPSFRFLK